MKQVIQTQVYKHFDFNLKLVKNLIILFVQAKKKRTMLCKNLWDTNCVQFCTFVGHKSLLLNVP